MDFISVHLHSREDFQDFPVHPYFREALFERLLEEFSVMAFSAPDEWCEQHDFFSGILFQDAFPHLFFAVSGHRLTRGVGESFTDTGKE